MDVLRVRSLSKFLFIKRRLYALYLFTRFSVIGFSAMLPLFGAATAVGRLTVAQIIGLLGIGITFHCFAYVLNDVIDLPVDRKEPLRADYPLVRGVVSRSTALAFALLQIPIAYVLLAVLGGTGLAYMWLTLSLVFLAAYNCWGKRCFCPFLTDFVQGCGWSALAICGASALSQTVWPLMLVPFVFFTVYVIMINGVHGSLRDLPNDFAQGVRSMAIQLGSRPKTNGGVYVSRRLKVYALVLQVLLSSVAILPVMYSWLSYRSMVSITAGILTVAVLILAFSLLIVAAMPGITRTRAMTVGFFHMIVVPVAMITLFSDRMGSQLVSITLLVYVVPYLLSQTMFRAVWVPGCRKGISLTKRLVAIVRV